MGCVMGSISPAAAVRPHDHGKASKDGGGANAQYAARAGGSAGAADPGAVFALDAGVVKDKAGKDDGRVDKKGRWFSRGNDQQGTFGRDGTVSDPGGKPLGRIASNGAVYLKKERTVAGKVHKDGSVMRAGSIVGYVTSDGAAFDYRGRRVGMCSAGMRQAAFIFFFYGEKSPAPTPHAAHGSHTPHGAHTPHTPHTAHTGHATHGSHGGTQKTVVRRKSSRMSKTSKTLLKSPSGRGSSRKDLF